MLHFLIVQRLPFHSTPVRGDFRRPPLLIEAKIFSSLLMLCCAYAYHICLLWYIGSYTIIYKAIQNLELKFYPMIQLLIIIISIIYQIDTNHKHQTFEINPTIFSSPPQASLHRGIWFGFTVVSTPYKMLVWPDLLPHE